ncbi:MAG: hypothetical protein SGPRY_014249, partial [Prymnesium sp.]
RQGSVQHSWLVSWRLHELLDSEAEMQEVSELSLVVLARNDQDDADPIVIREEARGAAERLCNGVRQPLRSSGARWREL